MRADDRAVLFRFHVVATFSDLRFQSGESLLIVNVKECRLAVSREEEDAGVAAAIVLRQEVLGKVHVFCPAVVFSSKCRDTFVAVSLPTKHRLRVCQLSIAINGYSLIDAYDVCLCRCGNSKENK